MKRTLQNTYSGKGELRHIAVACWFIIPMIGLVARADDNEAWRTIKIGSLDLRDAGLRQVVKKLAEKSDRKIHLFSENRDIKGVSELWTIDFKSDKDGTLGAAVDDLLSKIPGSKVASSKQSIVLMLHSNNKTDEVFSKVWKDVSFKGSFEDFVTKYIRPRDCNYCGPGTSRYPSSINNLRLSIRVDGKITRRELLVKAADSCGRRVSLRFDPIPRGITVQQMDATLTKVLSEEHLAPRHWMILSFN